MFMDNFTVYIIINVYIYLPVTNGAGSGDVYMNNTFLIMFHVYLRKPRWMVSSS